MAIARKLKLFRGYYISAHRRRMDFYNWKWRIFVILLAALTILFINDYLQAKYVGTIAFESQSDGSLQAASYVMGDKLFNWFMTGMLFGVIALAVMYEGEFILGLRKMIVHFEKQAEREVGQMVGLKPARRKTVKQRKK